MNNILKIISERHSSRTPFNPNKPLSKEDIIQIIESAKWAPTANNMQNYEIIVIDDKKIIKKLSDIKTTPSEEFIRENLQQLSSSEDELKKKKVGILGTNFPPSWRDATQINKAIKERIASPLSYTIKNSPSILIVMYDSRKRAPASEGDVLGILSLGCVMENMWIMSESLGIGFQIMSVFSNKTVADDIKQTLNIPKYMEIAYAIRLGYPTLKNNIRIRRDLSDFTHHNTFGEKYYLS